MKEAFRRFKKNWRTAAARREILSRKVTALPHGLDRPLVVSLTSYPGRYGTLADTLRSLLHQTVKADRTILWLTEPDRTALPNEITVMERDGLEIAICDDLRSFKKIVPVLETHYGDYVATADDDVPYWSGWLEELVTAMKSTGAASVAHRAHRVVLGAGGLPLEYKDWVRVIAGPETGALVFPTGVLGVLYDTMRLHPDVTNTALFSRLCPLADDVWLYWMVRMAGGVPHKIAGMHRVLEWPGSQEQALRHSNLTLSGNDQALAAMIDHYGFRS